MQCPNCHGQNIEVGIAVAKAGDAHTVGPKYEHLFVYCAAQMYCDLCLDCGEIVRFYINEPTNKKWVKKSGIS
jgi:hypothetical protein